MFRLFKVRPPGRFVVIAVITVVAVVIFSIGGETDLADDNNQVSDRSAAKVSERRPTVQLPHTGGSAVAAEICENYDAERILRKHSRYHEFLRIASPEQAAYKVFAAIRNPMDEAVSIYFK